MDLSRWGRSAYDTDEHWAAEARDLVDLVSVRPPGRDAQVVVVNSGTRVDAALLDQTPSARLVITSTSGYEHLDRAELARRGIVGARLPLVRRDAVAEASLELLLTGLRCTGPLGAASQAGRWARGDLPGLPIRTLRGATVGLIGVGVIGRRMVEILQALGATVWASDPAGLPPGVPAASPAELVARCDAVSVHCSLTPSAERLVDAGLLAGARTDLVLVNTARGRVVDAAAATAAVLEGRLAFLGLDCFPEEPWPDLQACADPRIVFTPHASGWHAGLPAAVTAGLRAALSAWARGEDPPFRVC